VKRFVERAAASSQGRASRCKESGEPQLDFALADLFGAHVINADSTNRRRAMDALHTYLRLTRNCAREFMGRNPETNRLRTASDIPC